jgi:hypothetical protein
LLKLIFSQFLHCFKSGALITDRTVQINSVIKSLKTISTAQFRLDGSDVKLRENRVINSMESVSFNDQQITYNHNTICVNFYSNMFKYPNTSI